MNALVKAFFDKGKANTALMAGINALSHGIAPQRTAYPYIVFDATNMPEYSTTSVMEQVRMRVDICAADDDSAKAVCDLVRACYDDAILSPTGYTHIVCSRDGEVEFYDEIDECFRIELFYLVQAAKAR